MKHAVVAVWMFVASASALAQAAPAKARANADPKDGHREIRALARNLAAEVQAPLTPAELEVSSRVHVGTFPCELGQVVILTPEPSNQGYFSLRMRRNVYRVSPEETTTGAIRLEDKAAGIVWLQLANKSMLMSQKLGQRLADECHSPLQAQVAKAMMVNPPRSVLEVVSNADIPQAKVD